MCQTKKEGNVQIPTDKQWIFRPGSSGGRHRAGALFESLAPREGIDLKMTADDYP